MCRRYEPTQPKGFNAYDLFLSPRFRYKPEVSRDSVAPILRRVGDLFTTESATFGLIPRKQIPKGIKLPDTSYAKAESIDDDRSFRNAWKARALCLVPIQSYFEIDHAAGVRWRIRLRSGAPFAAAGLWRAWNDPHDGTQLSFALITVGAEAPPMDKRTHRPGAEIRSVVIIPADQHAQWLSCSSIGEARRLLRSCPTDALVAEPSPLQARAGQKESSAIVV
ncbi:SOS response-associated peptidase family protein [Caballeronia sp. M23-90]